ncbi:MAG: hypothetical protein ABFS03_00920 [Chloroflexota bacterium]
MANLNSDQYNNGLPNGIGVGDVGNLKVLMGSITLTAAQSAADTVTFFTAPEGFTPLSGMLIGDDIDTGTETYEFDIGVSGDTTKYLDSGVITGDTIANEKITVGIKIPLQEDIMLVKPTAFTADTDIIGTVTAAANAGGTGTLTLIMYGVYNDHRIV